VTNKHSVTNLLMLSVQKRCKRQLDVDKCDKLEHDAGYVTATDVAKR